MAQLLSKSSAGVGKRILGFILAGLLASLVIWAIFGRKPSQAPAAEPVFEAYLKASESVANFNLGLKVAVSGNTLVATGFKDCPECTTDRVGAAYVFVKENGQWTRQARLAASEEDPKSGFGASVAIERDLIFVGDPFMDSGLGGVYVFRRTNGAWRQEALLRPSNADQSYGHGWRFGTSVSISNGTAAIGASLEGGERGAVYVFTEDGGAWREQAILRAPNRDVNDYIGAVSISGDTIVFGAYGEDSCATGVNGDMYNNACGPRYGGPGAAYVWVRTGGAWRLQAYLKPSNTKPTPHEDMGMAFGGWTAISGDTIAVGAFDNSCAKGVDGEQSGTGCHRAGAVYVFVRKDGTWSQEAYIKASDASTESHFVNVSLDGGNLLVGALGQDGTGAAYLFRRRDGRWTEAARWKAPNAGAGDSFGSSVAITGDLMVVGAHLEDSAATGVNGDQSDNSKTDSGAAYVYSLAPTATRITSVAPAGAIAGEPYAVSYEVTSPTPGAVTGYVVVSDGAGAACMGPAPAGSCTLYATSPGEKTISATYRGEGPHAASSARASLKVVAPRESAR